MTDNKMLPADLVWAKGGHLSDVALTAIADGQETIVPREAMAHLESCEACAGELGAAALLSLDTSAAVSRLPLSAREVGASAPLSRKTLRAARAPLIAIAAALAAAILGMLPTLVDAPRLWDDASFFVRSGVPLLVRTLPVLLQTASAGVERHGLLLMSVSALVLVIAGLTFTRLLPRPALAAAGASSSKQGAVR